MDKIEVLKLIDSKMNELKSSIKNHTNSELNDLSCCGNCANFDSESITCDLDFNNVEVKGVCSRWKADNMIVHQRMAHLDICSKDD